MALIRGPFDVPSPLMSPAALSINLPAFGRSFITMASI